MPVLEQSRVGAIEGALRKSWSRETALEGSRWSSASPAQGQCAVTALVVQDLLGGSLLRGELPSGSHYWNRLPSGEEIDFTAEQFPEGVLPTAVEERDRSYLLSDADTFRRYALLRAAVEGEPGQLRDA